MDYFIFTLNYLTPVPKFMNEPATALKYAKKAKRLEV